MAYIKINLDAALMDGHNITFQAPCDCTAIDGLKVCYIKNDSLQEKIFSMKDTHGNALAGLGNLFKEGAYIHAILDSKRNVAYLQNADTNGYLENKIGAAERAIEQLANNQIPEEYLQACVDDYISNNQSGLVTKTDLGNLNNDILNEINEINVQLSNEKVGYKTFIDTNTDINSIVDVGIFNITNKAASECVNYPSNVGGMLTVNKRTGYDYPITQTLIDNGNALYTRYKTESGWSDWNKYANAADVENAKNECISFRNYITNPINLDNIMDIGVYQFVKNVVPQCSNYPSAFSGFLLVVDNPAGVICYQQLIDSKGNLYIRYKTESGWSDWNKYSIENEVEKHTDNIGALVEIAESYFNVAYNPDDVLIYQSKHGLFSPQYLASIKKVDENGNAILDKNGEEQYDHFKAIVCSQFEQACIGGIAYENSRYVTEDNRNKPYSWGFVSDGSGVYAHGYNYTPTNDNDLTSLNDYMTACEQAKYFENKGLLNTFDPMRNGLKPGDLLFFDDPNMEEKDKPNYYRQIVHVGICLTAGEQEYTMMESAPNFIRRETIGSDKEIEAGVSVRRYLYTTNAPKYYVHSPILAEYTSKKIAEKAMSKQGEYNIGSSAYIGSFTFDSENYLERGFYTLQFEEKGNTITPYIIVDYDAIDAQGKPLGIDKNGNPTITYYGAKHGDIASIVFYAEFPVKNIIFRVANTTGAAKGKFNCSWAKLFKGYHP